MMTWIHSIQLTQRDDVWRVEAMATGGPAPSLWFEIEGHRPTPELLGAAFFIPAALHAMHSGTRLSFAPVLSELFVFNFRTAVAPLLRAIAPDLFSRSYALDVTATRPIIADSSHSITGMSCGLDSMAAACELLSLPKSHTMSLGGLALFDTGNHNYAKNGGSNNLFANRRGRAQSVAAEVGVPLLTVRSNLEKWFPGGVVRLHTLRNAAAAHTLTGFARYYSYANGVKHTDTALRIGDTAHVDSILLPLLSTEALALRQATPHLGAPEKINLVADWGVARKHLNVCYYDGENCGRCEKCLRRILLLDAAGKWPAFKHLFPRQSWEKDRGWYVGYVLCRSKQSIVYAEMWAYLAAQCYVVNSEVVYLVLWYCHRLANYIRKICKRPRRA